MLCMEMFCRIRRFSRRRIQVSRILSIYLALLVLLRGWRQQPVPVDVVITWVNGSDAQWQKEKDYWRTQELHTSEYSSGNVRFRDNQELRYCLRSIFWNAPWVRKIFIVTNGQIPKWLNTNHPKIQMITHSQIMPRDALPTFNSEAIETSIAKIDGLADLFLYSNDDTYIYRQTTMSFFFTRKYKPIIKIGNPKLLSFPDNGDMWFETLKYTAGSCSGLHQHRHQAVCPFQTL